MSQACGSTPFIFTRAPRSSTVTAAASGDPEGAAAAGSDVSDTKGTNEIVYPPKAAPVDLNAPGTASRAPAATGSCAISVTTAPGSRLSATICAFKSCGQLLPACASRHFYTLRQRSSYVVRMVVHFEHPCRR